MVEPECGLLLLETEIFQKYIQVEKENKGTILQSFLLSAKLYFYGEEDDKDFILLNQIGEDINSFVEEQKIYSEDVVFIINQYLSTIVDDKEELDITNSAVQKGIDLINKAMSKGNLLSPKMLQFYILCIAKVLNVDDYVQNISISMDEKVSKRGSYLASIKQLTVYYDYIRQEFNSTFQRLQFTDQVLQNILCNQQYIRTVLHELGHAVEQKRVDGIYYSSSIEDDCMKDILFSSWIYNGKLLKSNRELYELKYDLFIGEARAELFSILQFSRQTNDVLKGVFNESQLTNMSAGDAYKIVEFYTERTEKGRKVISPFRQFIQLYNQNMPENEKIQYTDKSDRSIMENLMLGFDVPFEIIKEINKIARGEIITTNLYKEITKIIADYHRDNKQMDIGAIVVHK